MDKFLLILFFIIKILIIIVFPILLFIFKNKLSKDYFRIENGLVVLLVVLYIIGFSYVTDSNLDNIFNLKMLTESKESKLTNFMDELDKSNVVTSIESSEIYKTHRNDKVYYYNGFEKPLSTRKIECEDGYDYFKYYSDLIVSTSTLLSSYFDKQIDPIEVYNKAYSYGLIKCGEPISENDFFYMIDREYKVNFLVIRPEELENYILNGKIVLLETKGNGVLSCNKSYFIVYNINNSGEFLLLDPNNKSYDYICPDGTNGFGSVISSDINKKTYSYTSIMIESNRLIVIGGTK